MGIIHSPGPSRSLDPVIIAFLLVTFLCCCSHFSSWRMIHKWLTQGGIHFPRGLRMSVSEAFSFSPYQLTNPLVREGICLSIFFLFLWSCVRCCITVHLLFLSFLCPLSPPLSFSFTDHSYLLCILWKTLGMGKKKIIWDQVATWISKSNRVTRMKPNLFLECQTQPVKGLADTNAA